MLTRFGTGRPFPPVTADAGPPISFPADSNAALDHTTARGPASEQPPPVRAEREPQARIGRFTPPIDRATPPKPRRAPATGIGLGELPGRREPTRPSTRRADAEPEPEPESEPEVEPEPEPDAEAQAEPEPDAEAQAEPASPAAPEPASSRREPDAEPEPGAASDSDRGVDALFERIRTMGEGVVEEPRIDFDEGGGTDDGSGAAPAEHATRGQVLVEARPEPRPVSTDGDPELLARRDELLTPIAHELVRHCKRVLQNEQNEILDALRRQRGRPTPDKLLPPLSQQVAAWSEVLAPAITEAYVAARTAAEPGSEPVDGAPERVVTAMVEVLVTPLRDRLLAAVDETLGDDANPDVIAHRIGARYREWKGQELDSRIRDLLAAVYARGVYDAAPEGSRLRWVPAEQGQCPDADDNALEPTRRGGRFPTGQQFPPAHPGCRCLLAVVHEEHTE
jgi:hypothetical protein